MPEPSVTTEESAQNQTSFLSKLCPPGVCLLIIFIMVPLTNYVVPEFFESQSRFVDDSQTKVDAAGYAFAIWGVIFTGMIVFSAYLAIGKEPLTLPLWRAMVALCIAGIASVVFVPLSIEGIQLLIWFDILLHLIPLALANWFLRQHVAESPSTSRWRWVFFAPSMYFGWICAATVISTALMMDELGIEFSETVSTASACLTGVGLGLLGIALTLKSDPVVGATVSWALIAIGVEQSAHPPIQTTAFIMAGLSGITVLFQLIKRTGFYAIAANPA